MEVASGPRPIIYATARNTFRHDHIRKERRCRTVLNVTPRARYPGTNPGTQYQAGRATEPVWTL
jgi:hypothetical protein